MNDHDFNIANLRKNYELKALSESEISENPFAQFAIWFNEAIECLIDEPNAMALATVGSDGFPHNRIVLLKGFSSEGLSFFTNYNSLKGQNLEHNNKAAVLFFYKEMERQIRISGTVQKISEANSEEYFASRPKDSRIAAWVSEQSSIIPGRYILEERFNELSKTYATGEVPKPPHWGGYILRPQSFEFWQGRANRLHDRLLYRLKDNIWHCVRLAP
ncbi:MAG: pyridoxamine 5'-phosphate oxidase [Ignavibacteriales bacterium]|nr:pyridoxamine 5'-phosphate oxidase [Ignavibacteriales bacterium]